MRSRAELTLGRGLVRGMNIPDSRVGRLHLQHPGDVRSLAVSIETLGLLHHIVVSPTGRLVAGARRLAAVGSLGWTAIPVHVVRTLSAAANAVRAEHVQGL